ncbi:MAG: AAA family ATPase [Actinomycetota bacterium]|nr:AAA family ATPase [Actinomycetota bacterium]
MSIHTTVTTISHGPVGMGQVWYRVTGVAGVTTAQVAYRAADHDPQVRRVRFVGTGGTARLLGFTPGEVVASAADVRLVARAFSGEYLTHGVKTVRSRLSRIAAAPVRDAVVARMAEVGLVASEVFAVTESAGWWSALNRAADRGRTVSLLTARGVLRVARSHQVDVDPEDLWSRLGAASRSAAGGDVDLDSPTTGFTDLTLDLELADVDLGRAIWERACALAEQVEVVGNAGYELTLTLPKSFSLVALSGDPARMDDWFELMQDAADHALARLMAEAGFCSTGHRGDGQEVTVMPADGWAGFTATEISSRAGDPHLHVHCTLPNVLVGRDGLVRTMADGGRELHVNAPRFAAWGQAYAVREALARGLVTSAEFDVETFQWKVGGFDQRTLDLFSKARRSVQDETADDDLSAMSAWTRAGRDRAAKRRITGAKSGDQPTWTQLRERCRAEAAAEGIDLDAERDRILTANWPQPPTWTDGHWAWAVEGAVCANSATTSRAKVLAHVDLATALLPASERERITAQVLDGTFARSHPSHDLGMKSGGHQFASRPILEMENELTEMFLAGLGVTGPRLRDEAVGSAADRFAVRTGFSLNSEQIRAVYAMGQSTDAITLVSGVAGSGKTSVLSVLNDALEKGRKRLLVASTANAAAAKAGDESGAPWMNLRQLALRLQDPKVSPRLFDVVVIDEASLADVRSIHVVAEHCVKHGRQLILMGDHRQLKAVGAGEIYNVLCARHPLAVIRLERNQRQQTESGRIVADALHARHFTRAWDVLHDESRIVVVRGPAQKVSAVAAMVVDHMAEHGPGQVTCDAVTNAEVDAINARVHDHLVGSGAVDAGSVREFRQRGRSLSVGVGTVLRVVEPTGPRTAAAERLHRSQRATVVTTVGAKVQVQLDDGSARALTPAALLRHFAYGYAGTVHKVQGQTSAVHVSALSPMKDAASLYVSASRARLGVFFVADATEFLADAELQHTRTWGKAQFDDAVIDRIESVYLGRTETVDSAAASMLPKAPAPAYSPHAYGAAGYSAAGYSAPRRQEVGLSW